MNTTAALRSIAQDIIDYRDLVDIKDAKWYVAEEALTEAESDIVMATIVERMGF